MSQRKPELLPLSEVMVTAVYKRVTRHTHQRHFVREMRRCWEKYLLPEPIKGNLIGIRTLQNGILDGNQLEDEMPYLTPTEYIRAYLVYIDMRKRPLLVPVDSLALTPEAINWILCSASDLDRTGTYGQFVIKCTSMRHGARWESSVSIWRNEQRQFFEVTTDLEAAQWLAAKWLSAHLLGGKTDGKTVAP